MSKRLIVAVLTLVSHLQLSLGARSSTADQNLSAPTMCPPNLPDLPHFDENVASQCSNSQFGTLFVGCISATDLAQKHWWRDNRPLCRVEMVSKTRTRDSPGGRKPARVGKVFETPTVQGNKPVWKQAFHYEFACVEAAKEMKDYMLQVQIKDEGMIFGTKSHLGYAYVDFAKFDDFAEGKTTEYELEGNRASGADARTTSAQGKVKIALKWCSFGDVQCLRDAAAAEGLRVAGSDWNDCHDGCHNALVETLHPIHRHARHLMATAVQAGLDEEKFDDIEDEYEEKAEQLDEWLEHNPIDHHWKYWVRPGPPPCPPGHGGPDEPPCPGRPPLTPEQNFALTWQAKKRERDDNERKHEEFKRREEQAEKKAKEAFSKGKDAMDTIGDKLVDGARKACGESVIPFIEDAGAKITKMPEGKFKTKKAQEAVRQLDAVWRSIAEFKDCLLSKWKHGDLLPSREVEHLDEKCFQAMSS